MRNASSSRKNTPETISRTSVCAPNPIASPRTPAPASSGPILMPSDESITRALIRITTKRAANRNSGISVSIRVCGIKSASSASISDFFPSGIRGSIIAAIERHATQVNAAVNSTLTRAAPASSREFSPNTVRSTDTPHNSRINTAQKR